ncbi:hypothetical protein GLAREA_01524 [Glarea lozoyensis ATCC 20868]|uniref:Uncharacterized protein n=1 Tax=Glarea lozoyensis (strain ATCC 20868 / MF5171) TaxID=1116229 RepID=S3CGG7_GLAL2|nr:uncharacterized protein GLAREA_01524 [Glarea lozoyensis ATCC 20868]EPE25612.1 hypothetical protein GLAREA_01524 [Glarea lozoyensis ATCC 20868]
MRSASASLEREEEDHGVQLKTSQRQIKACHSHSAGRRLRTNDVRNHKRARRDGADCRQDAIVVGLRYAGAIIPNPLLYTIKTTLDIIERYVAEMVDESWHGFAG